MPSTVIVGIEVGNNTIRKFNQGKAQKCPLRISAPVYVGGSGFLTAGAARVIGPNASGGVAGAYLRGNVLDRLRAEPCKRHAGVGAVGPVNGKGQVIAEITQTVVRRFVLSPDVILLVGHPVQGVAVQLGWVAFGPADTHRLAALPDYQRVTGDHSLLLTLGQLFGQSVGTEDHILKSGQAGVEQPAAVQLIGNAGEHIRQVDQDTVLVRPTGAVQVSAGPATLRDIANLDPVAALVLQKGKWSGSRDGGGLGVAALGLVNGEDLITAVPGGGAGHVQLEAAGRGVRVGATACVSGESGNREHTSGHNDSQQTRNCPFPMGFHTFQH